MLSHKSWGVYPSNEWAKISQGEDISSTKKLPWEPTFPSFLLSFDPYIEGLKFSFFCCFGVQRLEIFLSCSLGFNAEKVKLGAICFHTSSQFLKSTLQYNTTIYHGNPQPSFLESWPIYWGFKTFIFHGVGVSKGIYYIYTCVYIYIYRQVNKIIYRTKHTYVYIYIYIYSKWVRCSNFNKKMFFLVSHCSTYVKPVFLLFETSISAPENRPGKGSTHQKVCQQYTPPCRFLGKKQPGESLSQQPVCQKHPNRLSQQKNKPWKMYLLVGGWTNPFGKYAKSQIGPSPQGSG